MSILENLFQQYLLILENVLREIFSDVLIERIITSLIEKYESILKSSTTREVILQDINQETHVVTSCFIIALYRTLKEKISNNIPIDEMLELSMRIFQKLVGPLADMQKEELKRADDKWKTFKESIIHGTRSTYSSFKPKFIKNDEKVLEFHLNKCIFYEVFKVHKELVLAPILCFYDEIFAEAVEEWITFERPKTIANGEDYCQFCYFFKEN
ncbi:MAG: L-2-amino-thiazoline-4-carboxylic acid hydrolase [Promethearchaeota archaeon]